MEHSRSTDETRRNWNMKHAHADSNAMACMARMHAMEVSWNITQSQTTALIGSNDARLLFESLFNVPPEKML
jgi:hypothetical protein